MIGDPIMEMLEIFNRLKKLPKKSRPKIFVVSNIDPIHLKLAKKRLRKFLRAKRLLKPKKLFDKCFYSYEMGSIKPDSSFFDKVLEVIEAEPSECIFIDDNAKNVAAAAKKGIVAIKAKRNKGPISAEKFLLKLEEHGILIP